MGEYDTYRNRVQWSGTSQGNAYENATIQFINQTFSNSPMFMNVPIGSNNVDIRLMRDKTPDSGHTDRFVVRPNTTVNEGDYATIEGKTWIVDKFNPHPYYPTGHILECGHYLKWKTSDGTVKQYACAMPPVSSGASWTQDQQVLQTTKYDIKIHVQYNTDTETIKEGLRILLQSKSFEIIGVDPATHVYNNIGFIVFTAQTVTSNPNDDFVNGIADNTEYYTKNSASSGGGWNWK